ncbi:hypothetical protein ASG43_05165 [Aureimonas sp. Leaf454]|uniref:polysaccharide biosynthesis/export family protein n=1 Tax=Aureimonas sp. Leaf454 TaxID=1736381 RepID=UPI0006F9573E|nr:polysaccharide biosynthesis/export family protein [Aureimonas sp. Leaf454]KQT50678.1 hypothetical protein ASG43_05165 [Aureimonas sp. Leaf454]
MAILTSQTSTNAATTRHRPRGRAGKPRAAWFAALSVVCLLASAGPILADQPAAQAADLERFRLAPGDRVAITVFDQAEISGSYLVEPMGTITLPLIGPVDVRSFTPENLQADLVRRFGNGYLQNPVISVRLLELRPLTVVGSVRAPGRYAYMDGMTVETAMALAGGSARLTNESVARRADFLQTDERLKSLKIGYFGQLARKARIEAQLAGTGTIETPDVGKLDAGTMRLLIEGEQEILTFQATSQARQLELLQEQSRQVAGDVAAFEEQATLEKEQIAYLDEQIKDFKSLLVNGLTKKSSVIDLQREKSKSRSDLSRILGDLARSKSTQAEVKLKLAELDTTYRSRLMTDLQETKLKLADAEGGLPLVLEARQIKLDQMPFATQTPTGPLAIRISRYRGGRMDVIEAERTTTLWPGDVLQIGSDGEAGDGPSPDEPSLRLPPVAEPRPVPDLAEPTGSADPSLPGDVRPERLSRR